MPAARSSVGDLGTPVSIVKPIVMAGGTVTTTATGTSGNSTTAANISLWNSTGLFTPHKRIDAHALGNDRRRFDLKRHYPKRGGNCGTHRHANTYSGTTTIGAGTLRVGAGGTSGSLGTGPVIDNAALMFNRSDSVTLATAVSGSGTLTARRQRNL